MKNATIKKISEEESGSNYKKIVILLELEDTGRAKRDTIHLECRNEAVAFATLLMEGAMVLLHFGGKEDNVVSHLPVIYFTVTSTKSASTGKWFTNAICFKITGGRK